MKLDKIKFAALVAFIQIKSRNLLEAEDVRDLDNLIDFEMVAPKQIGCNPDRLNAMLELMANGQKKIEAIKAYRELTGSGLKESKDAVEAYWIAAPNKDGPTLSDILGKT